jgi:hypothetical protein
MIRISTVCLRCLAMSLCVAVFKLPCVIAGPNERITNSELQEVQKLRVEIGNRLKAGTIPKLVVLNGDRMLNRAKYLRGDITKTDFLANSEKIQQMAIDEITRLAEAGYPLPLEQRTMIWEGLLLDKSIP